MAEHTSTPWKEMKVIASIQAMGRSIAHCGRLMDDRIEFDETDQANAAFICRAVNAHAGMVEALRALLDMPAACVMDDEIEENKRRRIAARAALKLAEEGQS